jgi:DeoR/GlpR family transcriptional regulator of sugar metabolism
MSPSKQIYDLIASRQAMSDEALMLASGLTEATVRSNIYFLRTSRRITRTSSRPAAYEAVAMSEPPKAYKPRQPREKEVQSRAPDSGFMALSSAWGGANA